MGDVARDREAETIQQAAPSSDSFQISSRLAECLVFYLSTSGLGKADAANRQRRYSPLRLAAQRFPDNRCADIHMVAFSYAYAVD